MATFRSLWTAMIAPRDASSDDRARLNPGMIIESDELRQSDTPRIKIQVIQGLPPAVSEIHSLEYRGPRTRATATEEVELHGLAFRVWSTVSITRGELIWRLRFDNGTEDYVLRVSLIRANADAPPSMMIVETEGRWRTSA